MIEHLGIEVVEIGDDCLKARMPVDHRTVQPQGRASRRSVVRPRRDGRLDRGNMVIDSSEFLAVGLEINANHIRPVKGGSSTARRGPSRWGARRKSGRSASPTSEDRLVCISRLTMAVIPMHRG